MMSLFKSLLLPVSIIGSRLEWSGSLPEKIITLRRPKRSEEALLAENALKSGKISAHLGHRQPVNAEDGSETRQSFQFCPNGKHHMSFILEKAMMLLWSRNALNTDRRSMHIPKKIIEDRSMLIVQHWMSMEKPIISLQRKLRGITMKIGREWNPNLFESH
jgi:hypothetical protein